PFVRASRVLMPRVRQTLATGFAIAKAVPNVVGKGGWAPHGRSLLHFSRSWGRSAAVDGRCPSGSASVRSWRSRRVNGYRGPVPDSWQAGWRVLRATALAAVAVMLATGARQLAGGERPSAATLLQATVLVAVLMGLLAGRGRGVTAH